MASREDAEKEVGQPFDRRDAYLNNSVIGDVYKYNSPAQNFSAIELNFNRDSKRLVAAYFYYTGVVSWVTMREKLGHNYKKQKMPNGRPGYLYQFQQRSLFITVDSAENVINVGIW